MLSIRQIIYMQMLNIKSFTYTLGILFLILTPASVCYAEASFIEQFQIQAEIDKNIANRITEYYTEDIQLPLIKQKIELLSLEKKLNSIRNEYKDKPVYWFIKGLNHQNLASYYNTTNNQQLSETHLNKKNKAYQKILQMSDADTNKLSAAIFSTMKHGLPQDLKIKATENELRLGGNGESDSYYWYLHWSKINQLKLAGKNKEAELAYEDMKKELNNSKMDMSKYENLTTEIEKNTLKQPAATDQVVSEPIQKKLKNTSATPKVAKNKKTDSDTNMTLLVSILIFIIFNVIIISAFYLTKLKNNK